MRAVEQFVREFVGRLRTTGAERQAEGANTALAYEHIARQLEREFQEWLTAPLTLKAATAESGYSLSAVKAIKRRRGGGALRRCDLPMRAEESHVDIHGPAAADLLSGPGRGSFAHSMLGQRGRNRAG